MVHPSVILGDALQIHDNLTAAGQEAKTRPHPILRNLHIRIPLMTEHFRWHWVCQLRRIIQWVDPSLCMGIFHMIDNPFSALNDFERNGSNNIPVDIPNIPRFFLLHRKRSCAIVHLNKHRIVHYCDVFGVINIPWSPIHPKPRINTATLVQKVIEIIFLFYLFVKNVTRPIHYG